MTTYRKKRGRRTGFVSLIRRDLRGRAFRTLSSGTAVAVMVGALFATMLLTSGANYSIEIARNRLGADIIVIPHGADVSSQPFYTLFYTPSGATSRGTQFRRLPVFRESGRSRPRHLSRCSGTAVEIRGWLSSTT